MLSQDPATGRPEPLEIPANARILGIRFSALGDTLLTFPALRLLRATYPSTHLAFLTDTRCAGLFDGLEVLDELLTLDRLGLKRLRPHAVAQLLNGVLRPALFGQASGASRRRDRPSATASEPSAGPLSLHRPDWRAVWPGVARLGPKRAPTGHRKREKSKWLEQLGQLVGFSHARMCRGPAERVRFRAVFASSATTTDRDDRQNRLVGFGCGARIHIFR